MSTVRLEKEMSYKEAVQTLGFRVGDWISPHLPSFRRAEQKLRDLIAGAEDDALRMRYREELTRLIEAVRVVEAEKSRERIPSRKGAVVLFAISLLVVGTLVGSAWWGNQWVTGEKEAAESREVDALLATGRAAVEKRRWPEATEVFDQVLALRPESTRARDGLQSIRDGKGEERRQTIGFLLGTAQAAMEARDWVGAEKACREVRVMDPDNARIDALLGKIREGRVHDRLVRILEAAEEAIREEQWEALAFQASELKALSPDHVDLPRIEELTAEGMKLMSDRRARARELYAGAQALDKGSYSDEALEMLREALRLETRPEYEALYRKIASHARTLRVPEEFETIGEALAAARAKDKVRIGEGTFEESLLLPAEVDIEGAGPGKTIVECAGAEASVVTIGEAASGSRLAGFTLRQSGVVLTEERFPVVAVDGTVATIEDCWVENGAGHGIAILGGSTAVLRSVRVTKSVWDGLAVSGQGSKAEVLDARFEKNFHHGIDAWDGGAVLATRTRCSENGLAGVVIMSTGVSSRLEGCSSELNRELGVLVSNGASIVLNENQILSNLLGGILVRDAGTRASIFKNRIMKNGEAGVVVDRNATLERFEENDSRDNAGQQVQLKAELKQKP